MFLQNAFQVLVLVFVWLSRMSIGHAVDGKSAIRGRPKTDSTCLAPVHVYRARRQCQLRLLLSFCFTKSI